MATRFWDPEDGVDAADGLTFANRKKSLLSVSTGAAAGDVIRLIASPGPNSVGTGTWTDNSRNVTIPSGLVKLVDDCLSAWTVSTNVTSVAANLGRKSGATGCFGVNIATAFTTGKVAYRTLGAALDLSTFQFIGLWVNPSIALPIGALFLDLCSDTTGDVAVASIPLDDGLTTTTANVWDHVFKDFGAALPASIQSIAIRQAVDSAAITALYLNNIVASKGKNAADHISLASLIGKNTVGEPEWYPLNSLSDTTAVIGACRASVENTSTPRPYRGTTESVTTYAMRALLPLLSSGDRTMAAVNGASGNPIVCSGGWDRTAMASQTGISVLSGRMQYSGWTAGTARTWWTLSKIGFAHTPTNTAFNTVGQNFVMSWEGFWACDLGPYDPSGQTTDSLHTMSCKQIWGHTTNWTWPGLDCFQAFGQVTRIHGQVGAATAIAHLNEIGDNDRVSMSVGKIDNNIGCGFAPVLSGNAGYLEGTIFANNAVADISFLTTSHKCRLHRCTLGSTTKYTSTVSRNGAELVISSEGGDPLVNTVYRRTMLAVSDATTRHAATGISWKVTLTTSIASINSVQPIDFKLADIAVSAGSLVTVTAWCRRDSLSLTCGIRVRGGELSGVSETRQDMTAAINTWEQRTITFTPTQAGVISLYGYGYGALASVWFDDVEASQV